MSLLDIFKRNSLRASSLLILLLAPFGLASPTWAADAAGTAIITLNVPITADGAPGDPYHAYYLRARTTDGKKGVNFLWHEGWAVSTPDDLASSGAHGAVIVKDLAVGDWEVYAFRLETHGGIRTRWYPTKVFSVPFKIQAGRATYIGSYQPVAYKYKNLLGEMTFGGAHFVVSDQSARDLPIARAKKPDLGTTDVDVFDVDKLNNPLLSHGPAGAAPDETAFSGDEPG
jgi:hypothetical protein